MTNLGNVFKAINDLTRDGILEGYAVAGAMAMLFYDEPTRTYDLDVFVMLPPQTGTIISMAPLYGELAGRGYSFDSEHVIMHDVPVQFLPAYNDLARAALLHPHVYSYDGVDVRVISAEYAVALAFQTGGKHRIARAETLMETPVVNRQKLDEILDAHGLRGRRLEGGDND